MSCAVSKPITRHKVDQNCECLTTNLNFWGVQTPTIIIFYRLLTMNFVMSRYSLSISGRATNHNIDG